MLKKTDTLPYVYTSLFTTEFTTERDETVRVDTISVFNESGIIVSFKDMIMDTKHGFVTELPTILKRRGTVDFKNNNIQIVPSINERGETYRIDNKLVYTIYIPESVANLEYGTCAQITTYSAYIHTMYFVFNGNIHSCYIINEKLGEKLSEYHSYFEKPFIRDANSIDELSKMAQEYKKEYERVKTLCDEFEPVHTENVSCNNGFIKYIG